MPIVAVEDLLELLAPMRACLYKNAVRFLKIEHFGLQPTTLRSAAYPLRSVGLLNSSVYRPTSYGIALRRMFLYMAMCWTLRSGDLPAQFGLEAYV
eukprot:2988657-Amphidinium_carterae.1